MKTSTCVRPSGFTLMELLVVISIIAILAGLSFPVMSVVSEKARETQAKSGAGGLALAITNFQAEYNRLPNPAGGSSGGSSSDVVVDTDLSNDLIKILLGQDPSRNPKEIPYYTAPMAKNDANGLISRGAGAYEVVDPWSTPAAHQYYHVVLDSNGDHKIENPAKKEASKFSPSFIAAQPADLITEVAVFSEGNPRKSPSSRKAITSW